VQNVLAAKVRPRALKWEKQYQTFDEEFLFVNGIIHGMVIPGDIVYYFEI
jgi:hypothetical protein